MGDSSSPSKAIIGQKTMANSSAVVIASDQSAIPTTIASLPLPSGAATESTLAKLTIAQGAALGSSTGPLIQGSISTSAPSYTNGTINPLSLTTAGALRTDSSATTQPISAVSLPLPTGAATNSALTTINTTLGSPFQAGGSIGNTTFGATQSGTWTIQPGNTANTTAWLVQDVSDGATGSAVPAKAEYIAGKNVSGNLQGITLDRNGNLNIATNTDKSVFGPLVVASRVQQLSADFSETLINNNIIQTTTGTGAITLASSNATMASGTGATSSAQITSIGTIDYLPGREMYAQYTAAFTTPTSAASTQETGLYNGTDGVLIGYNGLNFGVTTVANSVPTFVASSSFNLDTLTGAATSLFTRNGTPEAVNFAFKNVYRIRAGWLGAAPIFFEIMSPDGNWVTFHIVRVPNTSAAPAFLEPSLPFMMRVTKTSSDSTNLKVITTSWDAGVVDTTGSTDTNDSGSIAALTNAVTISTESKSTVVVDVTGTWVGTIQVQGDVGDSSWNPIYAINTNSAAAQTITANATLIIACAGFSSVRLVSTAWTSGSASINWVATSGIQAITAQAIGNIASGSPDTGNPIKIGGVYNSVLPTVASGSRVDLQLDSSGRLLTSTTVTSQLPAASFTSNPTINSGLTVYTAFTAAQKLAIKQFYAGGTGIGKQALYSYSSATTSVLNGGDFETSGDVANWPYFSNGGSGTGTAALSSTQAFTGTHSESIVFTTSDANHSNGIKQTFGTAQDFSGWRYVTAEFFNTVSAGGTYTRTISIVLTDTGGNTKKFDLAGLSNAAPFNASNWVKITGEINNPTSTTGTSFDNTSIASIELRFVDSATRAGTVYWDTARLEAQITAIFPIYHQANQSFNVSIDPVFVMQIGDQVLLAQTNNDTARKEYFAAANGVAL